MNYSRAVEYLESFQKMGMRLGLERISALLSHLGDPQNDFISIHIAGTNGKGSVAAMLSSILREAGYKVGLYTSPHLVDYTERIRINEKDISQAKFASAIEKVKKIIDDLPELDLTEFEVLTAASFLLLSREKVDIAVIEVGLGGSLDATNIITPVLSIITNVDLDHTDVLGDSINKIAREKGGIIKPGVPLVTGETKVWRILKDICKKKGSKFIRSNREKIEYVPFLGEHQVENAKVAVAGIKNLRSSGISISNAQINRGLRRAYWPGRLQVVSKKPLVILDGAHNPAGARALFKYLLKLRKKFTFILGMQANKNADDFIGTILPLADRFIVVRSSHPNALPKEMLARKIENAGGKTFIAKDLKTAVLIARKCVLPVCLTGSLYLVGDMLRLDLHA
jgi:dihydrofolate synthase/folylpolyglutamate synthase